MEDLFLKAQKFVINMKVGDFYMTSKDDKVECIKRDKNKIHLSNGVNIRFQKTKLDNSLYLVTNKKISKGNKKFDYINQILRDIEGYFVCGIHS